MRPWFSLILASVWFLVVTAVEVKQLDTTERRIGGENELDQYWLAHGQTLSQEEKSWIFYKLIELGSNEGVLFLLNEAEVEPPIDAILFACQYGRVDIVRTLLQDGRSPPDYPDQKPILVASVYNQPEIVRLLLEDPRVDPRINLQEPLTAAASSGFHQVVAEFLKDPRIDPSAGENHLLLEAVSRGNVETVRLLMEDGRVNAGAQDSLGLMIAVESNHVEMVRQLLKDPRVDPSRHHHLCLVIAIQFRSVEMLQLLLEDGRADPTVHDGLPFLEACFTGFADLVELFFKDARVNPSVQNHACLILSCVQGQTDIVRMYLHDEQQRFDPRLIQEVCFSVASSNGHVDTVRLLLRRVEERGVGFPIPHSTIEAAFQTAVDRKDVNMLKMLYSSGHVSPKTASVLMQEKALWWPIFISVQTECRQLLPALVRPLLFSFAHQCEGNSSEDTIKLLFSRWASQLEHWPEEHVLRDGAAVIKHLNVLWNQFVQKIVVIQRKFKHDYYKPGGLGYQQARCSFHHHHPLSHN